MLIRSTNPGDKKPVDDNTTKVKKLKELVEGYDACGNLKYAVYKAFGVNAGTVRVRETALKRYKPEGDDEKKIMREIHRLEAKHSDRSLLFIVQQFFQGKKPSEQKKEGQHLKNEGQLPVGAYARISPDGEEDGESQDWQTGSQQKKDYETLLGMLQHAWGLSENNQDLQRVRIAKKKFDIMNDLRSTLEPDSDSKPVTDADKLRICQGIFKNAKKVQDLSTHRDSAWDNCMMLIALCLTGLILFYGLFKVGESCYKYKTARMDKPESQRLMEAGLSIIEDVPAKLRR